MGDKIISEIKERVFQLCFENYQLELDDVGDYSMRAMKRNKPRHKEIYDEIVWRMQDYVDVCNGNFVDLNYEYGE